jgi:hypothetical protein
MTRQTLRGKHNQIVGYLEEKESEIILRDAHNVIAGRFSKPMNRTYDAHGGIVSASGNTLLTLLCGE